MYLEIADVHDYARIRVNGAIFEARAWQPYRWDITASLQPGNNDVQINVFATPSGRGGLAVRRRLPLPHPALLVQPAGRGGRGGGVGRARLAPPAAVGPELSAEAGRGAATPPSSGLLGPVRLVAR